jgi:hypothetical protein
MSATSFESIHRRAKQLEARLESRVQSYSSLAQRINASLSVDEENPLLDSNKDEHSLSNDIERDLEELLECINNMRDISQERSSGPHEEVLIRRYHEIHFDYSSEFKNTASTVTRKRESMDLFAGSNRLGSKGGNSDGSIDSSTAQLLRERNILSASMRSINEVISTAFQARDGLVGQRSSLGGAAGGLDSLTNKFPSFNRLIDGISKKKLKESLIVAVFTGILLCFCVWWMFLR